MVTDGKKVLFIGDNTGLLKAAQRYMDESTHIKADTVINKFEGLQKLEQDSYDLAVIDKDITDGDGLEILQKIKASWPYTKVIMLINEVSDISIGQAIESGVDDIFLKGFDVGFLTEKVTALLDPVHSNTET